MILFCLHVRSTFPSLPGHAAQKHLHCLMLTPPCFTWRWCVSQGQKAPSLFHQSSFFSCGVSLPSCQRASPGEESVICSLSSRVLVGIYKLVGTLSLLLICRLSVRTFKPPPGSHWSLGRLVSFSVSWLHSSFSEVRLLSPCCSRNADEEEL